MVPGMAKGVLEVKEALECGAPREVVAVVSISCGRDGVLQDGVIAPVREPEGPSPNRAFFFGGASSSNN